MKLGLRILPAVLFLALIFPLSARQTEENAEKINSSAGFPFIPSGEKWTRPEFEKVLNENGVFFQGSNVRRSVFLENRKVFDIPAVEMLVISDGDDAVTQIDIIYSNKGDSAGDRNLKRDIKRSGNSLKQLLTSLMGHSSRDEFGPEGMRNDVFSWQSGKIRFLLESRRREYTILHICYQEKSGPKQKKEIVQNQKSGYAENVRTTEYGDVYVENIPMVNQGDKGYCVPANVERLLRYYGITEITMHQLADAGETDRGGGTSVDAMSRSIENLRRKFSLKFSPFGEVRMSVLKKYISRGIPVMWLMNVNPAFQQLMDDSRAFRPKNAAPDTWLKSIRKYKVPQDGGGHMCLIVGYNEKTGEIGISNTWGDRELVPAWVPLKSALRVSQKATFVLSPKR